MRNRRPAAARRRTPPSQRAHKADARCRARDGAALRGGADSRATQFFFCFEIFEIRCNKAQLCAWLRPDSQGIWHLKVGGGRSPQSGPRLDARVLRQSALEELTNFARTESPRQGDRNKYDHDGGGTALQRVGRRRPRGEEEGGAALCSWVLVSMTFRVVRTNQYNQDLGLIHSTNGNHLESPNEGSSIDHQVNIHLHAQNITMFPTNETWYFTSQMLVSSSGGLILILTAQSTRNKFRIHSYSAGHGGESAGDVPRGAWLRPDSQGIWHFKVGGGRSPQSSPRLDARVLIRIPFPGAQRKRLAPTRFTGNLALQGDRNKSDHDGGVTAVRHGGAWEGGGREVKRREGQRYALGFYTCVTLNGSGIQLAVGSQPLRLRNHNFGLAHRIMVKRLATSPHDPLGITDSACKNQLVMVSVQYGPFNTYIPIRSTTIGKSRVARDPITMHTSKRSNSDITSVTS
ncbi:FBD-associated F-box protein-like [Dorcoceras hygrometricum]|uniref:FBD-associated F-box protein-like n=1 Tax=Dorcoceras hygrometricum TaxID=472368 RepID=A0A2Z7BWV2_9LAMI|nr:FBD-associated F-box protein-like [Dorcoceras hygrometricum]